MSTDKIGLNYLNLVQYPPADYSNKTIGPNNSVVTDNGVTNSAFIAKVDVGQIKVRHEVGVRNDEMRMANYREFARWAKSNDDNRIQMLGEKSGDVYKFNQLNMRRAIRVDAVHNIAYNRDTYVNNYRTKGGNVNILA